MNLLQITRLVENKYSTIKVILINKLKEIDSMSLTSDIVTLINSTRSFLLVTAQFVNAFYDLEKISLTSQILDEVNFVNYIKTN